MEFDSRLGAQPDPGSNNGMVFNKGTVSNTANLFDHGGQLTRAAALYGIAEEQWLDLSTGINPNGWPVPAIPQAVWQRLPQHADKLIATAAEYYKVPPQNLCPTAGSQAAIQALPGLLAAGEVVIPQPTFSEHALAWHTAGHTLVRTEAAEAAVDGAITANSNCRYSLVVNPNNPTGHTYSQAAIESWRKTLYERGGLLVVDEAFMDTTPASSSITQAPPPGLVVLRSVGKFFGLAGLRLGFMVAPPALCAQLNKTLGPWSLSNPAIYIGERVLADKAWQAQMQLKLGSDQRKLKEMLEGFLQVARIEKPSLGDIPAEVTGCALFQSLQWPGQAGAFFEHLAQQGILTRYFPGSDWLRIGFPATQQEWQRLSRALDSFIETY